MSEARSIRVLRIYLEDGTSFRMVCYPIANAFSAGAFGTEELGSLIMLERAQISGGGVVAGGT